MTERNWTMQQQEAISLRGRNILVSAAAGSGKTAVLVERIIHRVLDAENPLNLDQILVVTFTRAAAAQMKERIGQAIAERLEEHPDDVRAQRQEMLLATANITTIDSFCLQIVQEHAQDLDLDPGFRVADEAELELLRQDVCETLLESLYEQGDPDFLAYVDRYGSMRSDEDAAQKILDLFDLAQSNPWPEEWLKNLTVEFEKEPEKMARADWMNRLISMLQDDFHDLADLSEIALTLAKSDQELSPYATALSNDSMYFHELYKCGSYEEFFEVLHRHPAGLQTLPRLKKGTNEDLKKQVTEIRSLYKDIFSKIIKKYFARDLAAQFQEIHSLAAPMRGLVQTTLAFADAYRAAKRDRRVVDFSDLEHFALEILLPGTEAGRLPGEAAKEYQRQFEELYVDEYQDSNYIQELLLTTISRQAVGQPNLFLVGDVKQCIYQFRQARPDLFLKKYAEYAGENGDGRRINLDKNFRSRYDSVLLPVNAVFRQIMTGRLGGIDYDEDQALKPGQIFPACEEGFTAKSAELILVTRENGEAQPETEQSEGGVDQADGRPPAGDERDAPAEPGLVLQVRAAARRIRELTDEKTGLMILENGTYRRCRYGDIAILLRTMAGWSDTYVEILQQEGIPAYAQTQRGYFTSLEISTIMSLLRLIDNPRQDIPLAAVLRSPIGGFSDGELSQVRAFCPEGDFYEACQFLLRQGESSDLQSKMASFFAMLDNFRERAPYLSTGELLQDILDQTGYEGYVRALPGGETRQANLRMLMERAAEYEKTGYRGLFHFIRYIDKIQKYDVDYGDTPIHGESQDSVRILSIHKSKGLEFPVVIVGGLEKRFNETDSRGNLLLHPDLGLGPEFRDQVTRESSPTLLKHILSDDRLRLDRGEELRILYVAMTRAKEKLILLSGECPSGKQLPIAFSIVRHSSGEQIPALLLSRCNNYLSLLFLALARHPAGDLLERLLGGEDIDTGIFHVGGEAFGREMTKAQEKPLNLENSETEKVALKVASNTENTENSETQKATYQLQEVPWTIVIWKEEDLLQKERGQEEVQDHRRADLEALLRKTRDEQPEEALYRAIQERLEFTYPYAGAEELPVKVTVSEIKRRSQNTPEEVDALALYEPPTVKFQDQKEETLLKPITGAALGNVYHKVLHYLNWEMAASEEEITEQIVELRRRGLLTREEEKAIEVKRIWTLTTSPLGKRMACSSLKREQPFVIGVPAREVLPTQREEIILIQGIIDAYFKEGDDLVIVDYKTDRVSAKKGADMLKNKYQIQLKLYAKALEQLTGCRVKECYIYSLTLEEAIPL